MGVLWLLNAGQERSGCPVVGCYPCTDCGHQEWRPLSCGHRNCPQCQHHEASQWIERQQERSGCPVVEDAF
nr:transposase zinc-binding domain-containing protein [Desulfobotulus mexicanus]